jgi:hypothetical protein
MPERREKTERVEREYFQASREAREATASEATSRLSQCVISRLCQWNLQLLIKALGSTVCVLNVPTKVTDSLQCLGSPGRVGVVTMIRRLESAD